MRKLVFAALIMFIAFSAGAQSLRFGLTVSPQLGWLKIDNTDLESGGARLGFNYGILVDFNINQNENYAFSTGLLISHTGGAIERDTIINGVYPGEQILNLQYIEIPATIRLRTNEIGYMTYYGQFGLVPGINIRARNNLEVSPDPTGLLSYENDRLDNVNVLNLALYLSAGFEYSLGGNTAILAGLFYNNGFTNILNDGDDEKIAISNLGLKLGVLF